MEENKKYRVNTQEAVRKWKVVFKDMNITDEEKITLMSRYAEHHSQLDILNQTTNMLATDILDKQSANAYSQSSNLLPISLNLIKELNFKDKIVLFSPSPMLSPNIVVETVHYYVDMNEIDYTTLDEDNKQEYLRQKEKQLIKVAVESINELLESKSIIIIYQMVSNFGIETCTRDNKDTPINKMFLRSRFYSK